MAERRIVETICDICGGSDALKWTVRGPSNRTGKDIDLCDECAAPLDGIMAGRHTGLRKARTVAKK